MKVWKFGTWVALFATVLAGCSKDAGIDATNPIEPALGHRVITVSSFEANADEAEDESRTQMREDGQGVQWDENDVLTLVELAYNGTEEKSRLRKDSESITLGADNTATFSFDFEPATSGATKYVYRAIKVFRDIDLNDDDNLNHPDNTDYYVKNSQNPTASSFDPQADLLIAKQQVFDTPQSSLSFKFARGVAITRMTLKNLQPGEDVRAVSFYTDSDTGTPIVGKVTHNYSGIDADSECSIDVDTNIENYDNYRVTMVYDAEEADSLGNFPVYFATLPVKLTKTFTVHVITSERHYLKTVSVVGRNFELKLDCLNKFNCDLTDCEEPTTINTYVLVADPSDLEVGNQIILTSNFGVDPDVTNYAMGAQSGTYRLQVEVDKGDDVNTIQTTPDGAAIITLVAGSAEGSFAMQLPDGKYLAHTDSSYSLSVTETISAQSSWIFTYDAENSGMRIMPASDVDADSPYMIRYNKSASRFACYSSTLSNSSPLLVDVYKYMIPTIKAPDMIALGVDGGEDLTAFYSAINLPNDIKVIDYDKTVVTAASASNGVITYTVSENTTTESRDGYITLASESIPDNLKNIIVRQSLAQGALTQGKAYTFQKSSENKYTGWNTPNVYNSMTWTLAKVTTSGTPNVGSMDGRGQQIGAASNKTSNNTVTVVRETGTGYDLYCNNQTAQGIGTVSVKCCAKSGVSITVAVSVGGTAMTTTQDTKTISGGDSSAVATFDFTSNELLTGDVEITYTLNKAGALYLHTVEINSGVVDADDDPVITLNKTSHSATVTGGSNTISDAFLTNVSGTVTAEVVEGTIVESVTVDNSNNSVTYVAKANHSKQARTDHITLKMEGAMDKEITVKQSADHFEVLAEEVTLGNTVGATQTFTIRCDYDCAFVIAGAGFTVSPDSHTGDSSTKTITVTSTVAGGSVEAELGTITIDNGTDPTKVVVVKQQAQSSGNTSAKQYTLTISKDNFTEINSGATSDYDKYSGQHTFTAVNVADASDTKTVVLNSKDVMISKDTSNNHLNTLQFKKNTSLLESVTNLGSIDYIECNVVTDNITSVQGATTSDATTLADFTKTTGTTTKYTPASTGWGYFVMKNGSSVSYLTSITIVFTIGGATPEQLTTPSISTATLADGKLSASWSAVDHVSSYSWCLKNGSTTVGSGTGVTTNSLSNVSISGVTTGTTYTLTVQAIGDGTNYSDSEVSNGQSVTATASGSGDVSEPTTVTFTPQDFLNNGAPTGSNITSDIKVIKEGVTLVLKKVGIAPRVDSGTAMRMYAENVIEVSTTSGKIAAFTVTATTTGYLNIYNAVTIAGATRSTQGNDVTWTLNTPATEWTFTKTGNRSDLSQIVVTLNN